VLVFAFEVVVAGVVVTAAAIASGGRPAAFRRGVVVSDFVAPRALDQGRGGSRPDKLDAPTEHANPLARRPLADSVVGVQDGRDNCGRAGPEVSRVALPMRLGAEGNVVEAGVSPQCGHQLLRSVTVGRP
jgi:hypothetical protein